MIKLFGHPFFPIMLTKQHKLLLLYDQGLADHVLTCLAWIYQTFALEAWHIHPYKSQCRDQLLESVPLLKLNMYKCILHVP